HFIATPNFHVFAMYSGHRGAQAVRAEFAAPPIHYSRDTKPAGLWGLAGSASQNRSIVRVTVVNPDLENSKLTQIAIRGARINTASGNVLLAHDVHDHNTFEQPETVRPQKLEISVSAGLINVALPAASVSSVEIELK